MDKTDPFEGTEGAGWDPSGSGFYPSDVYTGGRSRFYLEDEDALTMSIEPIIEPVDKSKGKLRQGIPVVEPFDRRELISHRPGGLPTIEILPGAKEHFATRLSSRPPTQSGPRGRYRTDPSVKSGYFDQLQEAYPGWRVPSPGAELHPFYSIGMGEKLNVDYSAADQRDWAYQQALGTHIEPAYAQKATGNVKGLISGGIAGGGDFEGDWIEHSFMPDNNLEGRYVAGGRDAHTLSHNRSNPSVPDVIRVRDMKDLARTFNTVAHEVDHGVMRVIMPNNHLWGDKVVLKNPNPQNYSLWSQIKNLESKRSGAKEWNLNDLLTDHDTAGRPFVDRHLLHAAIYAKHQNVVPNIDSVRYHSFFRDITESDLSEPEKYQETLVRAKALSDSLDEAAKIIYEADDSEIRMESFGTK